MRCLRQGSSKSSSGALATTIARRENHLEQAELLDRQIMQLDQDIIALQPKPIPIKLPAHAAESSEQDSSPPAKLRSQEKIPFPGPTQSTKRPSLMDSCEQSQQVSKKLSNQTRTPFMKITPGDQGSQKSSLKKFVSPVPTSQQSHADVSEGTSQKKKLDTREKIL